jgi:[pyruvate, water dikinase]-phosphate phosphotransferase / [pyruvate, water dikinase] kinase
MQLPRCGRVGDSPSPDRTHPDAKDGPPPNRREPRSAAKFVKMTRTAATLAPTHLRIVPARKPREICVLSDSTANLARHLLAAVMTQFPAGAASVRFESFVRTAARADEVLRGLGPDVAGVCHAIVSASLKRRVEAHCAAAGVPCLDLTGGVMKFLRTVTGARPQADVRALHRLDAIYRRRIGAMEFTLCHDDGLGLDSLADADVVLVGVSRTSKTPTSILLAQQGYRTANVSLAAGIAPPTQLLAMPRRKVIGLTMRPEQLALIRARRQTAWRMAPTTYSGGDSVAGELAWCRRLFREQGWAVLDVTDQAVEETAARIVEMLGPPAGPLASGDDVLPA